MAATVLAMGLLLVGLFALCDRGIRTTGVPWFDIEHEMRGTSKKSRGRMQQRKTRR